MQYALSSTVCSLVRSPSTRTAWVFAALCVSACEWVMGGIPERPELPGEDAAVEDVAQADDHEAPDVTGAQEEGSPEEVAEVPATPEEMLVPVPHEAGVLEAAAAGPGRDAATEIPSDAAMASDAMLETAVCTDASVWYPDLDGDGYGVEQGALRVCPRPLGSFAARAGDCHDGDQGVNPGHQRFESVPYATPRGTQSFDYDCSGGEDGTGEQAAHFGCGLLGALACGGDGYASTERTGFGLNSYCGSVVLLECKAELLATLICSSTSRTVTPYLCR
jgi:hypothetical protein